MLDEHEVATLENLIRRMTKKQQSGLEAWLSAVYDGRDGSNAKGSLWRFVKECQEYVHWYEVAPGERWGTPEEVRGQRLKVVK